MAAQKKYTILENEYFHGGGRTLYRIQAVRSFENITAGTIGGFIESEKNLSHEGNSWIMDDAKAYGDACVFENGLLRDKAQANDTWISGDSLVHQNARVKGAWIEGNARVGGNAVINGWGWVKDRAMVCGETEIRSAWVVDKALLFGGIIDGGIYLAGNVKVFGGYVNTALAYDNMIDYGVIRGSEKAFKVLVRTGTEIQRAITRHRIPA